MNRLMQWVMAAILICGSSVFTSCTNSEDNPVTTDLDLKQKIIGKWMPAELDGQSLLTDRKSVYTFVSATKAYMSVSINAQQGEEAVWNDQKELDVAISGNTMTLTNYSDEHTTMVENFKVIAIDGSEFTARHKLTVTVDGKVVLHNEGVIRFVKLTDDYSEAILGLWEFRKNDDGEWESVTTREFQDYFVDGTLLATRWKNVEENELREWWEIVTIKGDKMQWKALRQNQNEDGSTFEQTMDWEKVEED